MIDCMNAWVDECMRDEWMNGWMVAEWIDRLMNEWLNEWIDDKWMDRLMNESVDWWTNERMDNG